MNETLRTADGRAVLRIERRFAHPPEKVWRAITDPTELSQWFPATVTMEFAPDAAITFDLGNGVELGGRVLELDPPHVFAFAWDADILRFELQPEDGGTLLIFRHTFDDRPGAASFASGWDNCLAALGQLLDGARVEHLPPTAEQHDSYVEAFGLDIGSVEDTIDGWQVRFERQLTRPAEAVWAALAAGAPVPGAPPPPAFAVDPDTAGAVTVVQAPELLEYEWRHGDQPVGQVRWELSDERGTGHGARLVLTQTGPVDLPEERSAALAAWRDRLQGIAAQLR